MQVILNGIIIGGLYALMALGFNLIYSSVRFFHLLYGALAILGVYLTLSFQENIHQGFLLSGLAAALIIGFLGMAAWQGLYKNRVAKKSSPLVLLVISFGALIVLQNLIALIWGNNTYSISMTDAIRPAYLFWGLSITYNQLMILAVSVAVMLAIELFLRFTKYGLGIRAIGDNPELTTILGLKTNRIILLVFFIGSFLGSIGATLVSLEIGVRPTYALHLVMKAIIASIIGGVGSMRGALLGGLILGIGENIGIYYLGGSWDQVTAFLILTLFLLVRPQGLFNKTPISA